MYSLLFFMTGMFVNATSPVIHTNSSDYFEIAVATCSVTRSSVSPWSHYYGYTPEAPSAIVTDVVQLSLEQKESYKSQNNTTVTPYISNSMTSKLTPSYKIGYGSYSVSDFYDVNGDYVSAKEFVVLTVLDSNNNHVVRPKQVELSEDSSGAYVSFQDVNGEFNFDVYCGGVEFEKVVKPTKKPSVKVVITPAEEGY